MVLKITRDELPRIGYVWGMPSLSPLSSLAFMIMYSLFFLHVFNINLTYTFKYSIYIYKVFFCISISCFNCKSSVIQTFNKLYIYYEL